MTSPATTSTLFRQKDLNIISEKLEDILLKARQAENVKIEPTLADKKAMTDLLLDFIKHKGRIIYGGYAINELIRLKDPRDAFYDFSTEAPDIEFYSPEAVLDAKELCDMFHSKGYKYIRSTEAMHAETYKVMVNLHPVCDITYVPKNIYRIIPYVQQQQRHASSTSTSTTPPIIKFAHPHFLLIDSLRIITDPLTSYWRLDKAFPRIYSLQKHYPLIRPANHDHVLRSTFRPVEEEDELLARAISVMLEIARTGFEGGQVGILIGCAALQAYARWSPMSILDNNAEVKEVGRGIPLLEMVLTEYASSVSKIYHALEDVFGAQSVRYEEYHRFFDYCGRRGHIYVRGKLVARLFHHNNRCTPVLPSSLLSLTSTSETLRVATLSVTALYLHIIKLIGLANRDVSLDHATACDALIFALYDMRTRYLDSHPSQEAIPSSSETSHPFQDFTISCVGQSVAALRAHKEETEYRRAHPHLFGMAYFVYEPGVASKFNINDYKYMNSSGNIVRNERDQLFSAAVGVASAPSSTSGDGDGDGDGNGGGRQEDGNQSNADVKKKTKDSPRSKKKNFKRRGGRRGNRSNKSHL